MQQLAVCFAFEPGPLGSVHLIGRETMAEIERQTFIQQNSHAILAISESLASSSA